MKTRIKICGITNIGDALAACDLGADAIGFVFAESVREVSLATAAGIADQLPPFVRTVGVFTDENPRVADIFEWVPLDLIQLHGDQTEEFAEWLGARRVIRAVRMRDETSLGQIRSWTLGLAYLLDSGVSAPRTLIGERARDCPVDLRNSPSEIAYGGTGKTFDWNLAVRAKEFGKPIILAGGLTPENVASAIRTVRPYAVDVSSGVESFPGKKDYNLMKEFIANVRAADETA